MVTNLKKQGQHHLLVLDDQTVRQLGIGPDTPLQVTVQNGSIMITPVEPGLGTQAVSKSLAQLRPSYQKMLRHLAE